MKVSLKILLLFMMMYVVVSAFCYSNATLSNMISQTDSFINKGRTTSGNITSNHDTFEPIIAIGQILTTVGVAVMLGATAYMGIRYLTSGPEARAKLKTQLIGLVVSGVVIFGAYSIWKIVVLVASNF